MIRGNDRRSPPPLAGGGWGEGALALRGPLPPTPSRKGRGRISQTLLYVFLAIPLVYLLALVAFPVAYNILMSLQDVTLGNISDIHPPVGRLRQLPRGPDRSRLPQGPAQLAAVRRRQCHRSARYRPHGRAVLLATLPRRALPARPAARGLDAAGAGGRRTLEMAVRHPIRRDQLRDRHPGALAGRSLAVADSRSPSPTSGSACRSA